MASSLDSKKGVEIKKLSTKSSPPLKHFIKTSPSYGVFLYKLAVLLLLHQGLDNLARVCYIVSIVEYTLKISILTPNWVGEP